LEQSTGEDNSVDRQCRRQYFPVSENAIKPERVEYVRVIGPQGNAVNPQFRKLGNSLATDIALPSTPTTYVVVMSVKGHFLSMAPDEFEAYLKEEGLDALVAERARRGETVKPSRERFWRQAKVLISTGKGAVGHLTKPTGLIAELIPNSDLTQLRLGENVNVRLLYQGQPVNNAQIALTSSSTAKQSRVQLRRTDSEGRAHFKLIGSGPYLLASGSWYAGTVR
jgi:hypothetical protein